uniref:Nucleic acid-binding, OB-fold protein n=1 Tax=Tanacetum cinerariifolium TaxID=118510 RepID=A0A6L2M371_TANCI|nr:nucleic acid-binding, OB-fold protein [Tanacetum cinerariifolium]
MPSFNSILRASASLENDLGLLAFQIFVFCSFLKYAILQVIPGDPFPTCKNHGPQPTPVYSNNTNTLIKDCDDILAELSDKDQYKLPYALKELEGTTHVFQFHFDSGSSSRRRDLVLDRVFKTTVLPLPAPPLSYCFKAIINDGTAAMSLTCFSNNTNTLINDCDDILAELSDKDQYKLPYALKELEGTTHVFQFHFDSGSSSRRRDLVLDIFKTTVLPLPAPPLSEHQAEAIQHAKPLSPASSTPASNQPEVVEPETAATKEPQSTPPTITETVKPIKGDQQTNLPNTSTRKSLFKTEREADTSKRTKKAKHDK